MLLSKSVVFYWNAIFLGPQNHYTLSSCICSEKDMTPLNHFLESLLKVTYDSEFAYTNITCHFFLVSQKAYLFTYINHLYYIHSSIRKTIHPLYPLNM